MLNQVRHIAMDATRQMRQVHCSINKYSALGSLNILGEMTSNKSSKTTRSAPAKPLAGSRTATAIAGWTIDPLDYPTFRLTLIAKIMDRFTIRQLNEQKDLSYAEWRVLVRLATMPVGGTVREIAELAWVDRAEVSRAVQSLESKGLTDRRENPQDRRMPVLHVTKKGMQKYRVILKDRSGFHESLLEDLSPDDRAVLDDLLGRIGASLQRLLKSEE
ncbi:MAG: MarR family winged helix-turn-helix transcriptional regulator [Novosphingobium sp.]